jgi:hypothetical protein
MIYLFIGKNTPLDSIQQSLQHWKSLKNQMQFILGPNGDDVLRQAAGLEEFEYIFSLEEDIFQRLIDLRFEIEPNSIVITDLNIPMSRIFRFQEAVLESPLKTDFYRLLDIDQIDGAFFITKLGYHRLWSITPGNPIREAHFRWVNLDPDSCLNLTQENAKSSPDVD